MKLLILVLNKIEKLEDLLSNLVQNGIKGATIIDSTGMARVLSHCDEEKDIPFLGSLSLILNPDREKNKTIFIVLKNEQVRVVTNIVNETLGGFKEKDSGILFTLPIDYVQGINQ